MKTKLKKSIKFILFFCLITILLAPIASAEFIIKDSEDNYGKPISLLTDEDGKVYATFGEGFKFEKIGENIKITDTGGGQDPYHHPVEFFSDGKQIYSIERSTKNSEITFMPNTGEIVIGKGSIVNLRAAGRGYESVSEGSLKADKSGEIILADFKSDQGGSYPFQINKQKNIVMTFKAEPGERVTFNAEERKLKGESNSGRPIEIDINEDNKPYTGEPSLGKAKGVNLELSWDEKGDIKEMISLKGAIDYYDYTNKHKILASQIFFDGRPIKNLETKNLPFGIVSIGSEKIYSSGKSTVEYSTFVSSIKSVGKSDNMYMEYSLKDKFFDVQKGNAEIDNGNHKVILNNGKTGLELSDRGFGEGESLKIKYGEDAEKSDYLFLDEQSRRLVALKNGKETAVLGFPLQEAEQELLRKAQNKLNIVDVEKIGDRITELKTLSNLNKDQKKELASLYATMGTYWENPEHYETARNIIEELKKDSSLTKEEGYELQLSVGKLYELEGNNANAKATFNRIIADKNAAKEIITESYIRKIVIESKEGNREVRNTIKEARDFAPENEVIKGVYEESTLRSLEASRINYIGGNKENLRNKELQRFGGPGYEKGLGYLMASSIRGDIESGVQTVIGTLDEKEKGILGIELLVREHYKMEDIPKLSNSEIQKVFQFTKNDQAVEMKAAIGAAFETNDVKNIAEGGRRSFEWESQAGLINPDFLEKTLKEQFLDSLTSAKGVAEYAALGAVLKPLAAGGSLLNSYTKTTKFGATSLGQTLTKERYVASILSENLASKPLIKRTATALTTDILSPTSIKNFGNEWKAVGEMKQLTKSLNGNLNYKQLSGVSGPISTRAPVISADREIIGELATILGGAKPVKPLIELSPSYLKNIESNLKLVTSKGPSEGRQGQRIFVMELNKQKFILQQKGFTGKIPDNVLSQFVPIKPSIPASPRLLQTQQTDFQQTVKATVKAGAAPAAATPVQTATTRAAAQATSAETAAIQQAALVSQQAEQVYLALRSTTAPLTKTEQAVALVTLNSLASAESSLPKPASGGVEGLSNLEKRSDLTRTRQKISEAVLVLNKKGEFPLSNTEKATVSLFNQEENINLEKIAAVQRAAAAEAGKVAQISEFPLSPAEKELAKLSEPEVISNLLQGKKVLLFHRLKNPTDFEKIRIEGFRSPDDSIDINGKEFNLAYFSTQPHPPSEIIANHVYIKAEGLKIYDGVNKPYEQSWEDLINEGYDGVIQKTTSFRATTGNEVILFDSASFKGNKVGLERELITSEVTPSAGEAGKAAQLPEAPKDFTGLRNEYRQYIEDLPSRGESLPRVVEIDFTKESLGKGSGFNEVFEGTASGLKGTYAMKVFRNPPIPAGTSAEQIAVINKERIAYFDQEIKSTKILSDRGGPKFIGIGDAGGNPIIITEKLEGKSLENLVKDLSPSEVANLLDGAEKRFDGVIAKFKNKNGEYEYTNPDFQYYIITKDTFDVNGNLVRKAKDIVPIDAGSLSDNPIYVDTFERIVKNDRDSIIAAREAAQKAAAEEAEKAAQIPQAELIADLKPRIKEIKSNYDSAFQELLKSSTIDELIGVRNTVDNLLEKYAGKSIPKEELDEIVKSLNDYIKLRDKAVNPDFDNFIKKVSDPEVEKIIGKKNDFYELQHTMRGSISNLDNSLINNAKEDLSRLHPENIKYIEERTGIKITQQEEAVASQVNPLIKLETTPSGEAILKTKNPIIDPITGQRIPDKKLIDQQNTHEAKGRIEAITENQVANGLLIGKDEKPITGSLRYALYPLKSPSGEVIGSRFVLLQLAVSHGGIPEAYSVGNLVFKDGKVISISPSDTSVASFQEALVSHGAILNRLDELGIDTSKTILNWNGPKGTNLLELATSKGNLKIPQKLADAIARGNPTKAQLAQFRNLAGAEGEELSKVLDKTNNAARNAAPERIAERVEVGGSQAVKTSKSVNNIPDPVAERVVRENVRGAVEKQQDKNFEKFEKGALLKDIGGSGGGKVPSSGGGGEQPRRVTSLVKTDNKMLRLSRELEGDVRVQNDINDIMKRRFVERANFPENSLEVVNIGIGTKHLEGDIFYLRSDSGGRVFYRFNSAENRFEILGYAKKQNENQVIARIKTLYLK